MRIVMKRNVSCWSCCVFILFNLGCERIEEEPSLGEQAPGLVATEGGDEVDSAPNSMADSPPAFPGAPPGPSEDALAPGEEPVAEQAVTADRSPEPNRSQPEQCAVGTLAASCARDEDCADGTVCHCHPQGTVGTCLRADCHTDDDCESGACVMTGATTPSDDDANECRGRALEYHCVTERDECTDGLECATLGRGATCLFDRDSGKRRCIVEPICAL
jgi:hypothetical protein